ncbi:hypothetical protein BT96DRAFT_831346 [Gymnopus androsaceus JB14]|uniref:DUF6830 domain-containing protein n=1 Tax=Gymnopus androsaceus JB14 TaxID=1447944 RepID=A0A6A4H2M6_9AGAR|nr:hypothetical protein BT96DRAFT_831346 [Gymnopus androsaceus JB14]
MRDLVPLISGATSTRFVCAIRAIIDSQYSGQAPCHTDLSADRVQRAVDEFHEYKDKVLRLFARLNTKGQPLDNWEIPKLEFLHSIMPSIRDSGPISQWSADSTEHAHITEVKESACAGNNRDFETQICCHLDRHSRLHHFDLMTSMKDANVDFRIDEDREGNLDIDAEPDSSETAENIPVIVSSSFDLMSCLNPVSKKLFGSFCPKKNFFLEADALAPLPHRTFIDNALCVALSVTRDPHLKTLLISDVAEIYTIEDLTGALRDYLDRFAQGIRCFTIGGRRSESMDSTLPFTHIKVWTKVRIQGKTYHNLDIVTETHTIFAESPHDLWKYGRYDCAIINIDTEFRWPRSSLEGHCAVIVKLIFTVKQPRKPRLPYAGTDKFFAYCEHLDVVSQPPPPPHYEDLPMYHVWHPHYPDYPSGCFVL